MCLDTQIIHKYCPLALENTAHLASMNRAYNYNACLVSRSQTDKNVARLSFKHYHMPKAHSHVHGKHAERSSGKVIDRHNQMHRIYRSKQESKHQTNDNIYVLTKSKSINSFVPC